MEKSSTYLEGGVDYSTWDWEGDPVSKVLNRNLQKNWTTTTKKPHTNNERHSRKGGAEIKISIPVQDIWRVKVQNSDLLMIFIYLA